MPHPCLRRPQKGEGRAAKGRAPGAPVVGTVRRFPDRILLTSLIDRTGPSGVGVPHDPHHSSARTHTLRHVRFNMRASPRRGGRG
ncbi:hypothetical protein FTUN_6547 [Frigoriglobus tundricola]|uniref:Uncharacterized protein n=1 Tax=Frigoriglobus tundricola TaxID=2774151 RepID=A0A6M5Z169_9BACT|nr:hypothetical protein FTUN_6547 [Frigoriglobus tundricola]